MTPARCQAAARSWRALGERDDLRDSLAPFLPDLERLLIEIPSLEPHLATAPVTLCHGDFHAGNLLQGPNGEWIWADWQEARLGSGVDDLAFFWQRAFTEVVTPPPYEAMVESYVAGLTTGDGPVIAHEQVDQALAWAELRLWLVEWPGYLGFLPTEQIVRVLQRIDTLMRRPELERQR